MKAKLRQAVANYSFTDTVCSPRRRQLCQSFVVDHEFHIVSAFTSTVLVVTVNDIRYLFPRHRHWLATTVSARADNVREVDVVKSEETGQQQQRRSVTTSERWWPAGQSATSSPLSSVSSLLSCSCIINKRPVSQQQRHENHTIMKITTYTLWPSAVICGEFRNFLHRSRFGFFSEYFCRPRWKLLAPKVLVLGIWGTYKTIGTKVATFQRIIAMSRRPSIRIKFGNLKKTVLKMPFLGFPPFALSPSFFRSLPPLFSSSPPLLSPSLWGGAPAVNSFR